MSRKEREERREAAAEREAHIEEKRSEIKNAMATLGRKIQRGDNTDLLYWIIPGQFACAHRPLRYDPHYGGSGQALPPTATKQVEDWAELIRDYYGIKSIIALWHDRDLQSYRSLPLGNGDLIAYLKSIGFELKHHPYEDPAHNKTPAAEARKTLERIRKEAFDSYNTLPKPVLIVCSAGEDRSAPVAAYIHASRTSNKT